MHCTEGMHCAEAPRDVYNSDIPDDTGSLLTDNQLGRHNGSLADMFCDMQYTLPFNINEETFPVPTNIPEEPFATWLPGKQLRISYVSWNMGHRNPNLDEVATHCVHPNAHIIAVCTQENGNGVGSGKQQRQWAKYVEETCLRGEYKLVGRGELWYVQLLVFARRRDVARHVCQVDVSSVKTGIVNGLGGNKGGVAVALVLSMKGLSSFYSHSKDQLSFNSLASAANASLAEREENAFGSQTDCTAQHSTISKGSHITLLFIGAHLAAHQKAVDLRNKDYHSIIRALRVGIRGRNKEFFKDLLVKRSSSELGITTGEETKSDNDGTDLRSSRSVTDDKCGDQLDLSLMSLPLKIPQESNIRRDVTEEFDLTIFGGDLNYRIYGTGKGIECIIKNHKNIRSILTHNDQLNLEKAKGIVFNGFQEGNLLFRPTYKYKINENVTVNEYDFSTKKDRMPAYCDRVLYKKRKHSRVGRVRIRLYTDVPQVRTSDHRPVVAIFDIVTDTHLQGRSSLHVC